ncbi:TonB-dependent receptor [Rubrivirga sp. S365]|uniref:TonB-dependent receptor n=1 Tax=Rubrivirga litoralis TaxID=3075598 RepID=A0ABU3BQI5_9BACT|nr:MULTISPECIES: TonB-dependent receptor [unclassified Rubrivirga]MDT0631547.1 TonB-dependent receptor [Rubrivirga sp. F394]MDT7855470.1 TonB-dependent receptor [Rubrivirga sp. S365]
MRVVLGCLLGAVLLASAPGAAAQAWGEIAGRVTEATTGDGVAGATVLITGTSYGRNAGADGRYAFRIPEGTYPVQVSFVGYATVRDTVVVRRGETTAFDAVLAQTDQALGEVAVEAGAERGVGVSRIDPRTVRDLPTPVTDAIRSVKVELGVTSSNELSNAYSVRGGSYDENQIFIDGFEVYRPLRISQGEQEGLGLINGDLASRLTLFAGGFPVRYGGKLASVLDATYAPPGGPVTGTAYSSTLDAGAAVQGAVGGGVGVAVAARSARPQRFFAGQELDGAYDPDYRDVQGVAQARLSDAHALRLLGLYARHRFRLAPQQRETTFGIFPNLVRTVAVDFEGVEEDGYGIGFGGALLASRLSDAVAAEHRLSVFSTDEFETYDISSRTSIFRRQQAPDRPQDDLDRIIEGQATQADVADNEISQTVYTAQGRYLARLGRHGLEAGWQARALRFGDDISERTTLTGRGRDGGTVTATSREIVGGESLASWQGALWVEDALALGRLTVTPGLRADYFGYNDELTLSPRLGLVYASGPQTTLSASAGVYHQAPTYRELRGDPAPADTALRPLNGDITSPRAVQAVVGLEHFFTSRRVALRAEAYAKRFSDLISYDTENVRVVYSAENDSEGYAVGADVQLRGELVPGLESWVNYGFLVTRERFYAPDLDGLSAAEAERAAARFEARGGGDWVRRPTDRRHNLSLFVQDYVPGDDTWTLHIRTLLGSGVPVTAPARDEDRSSGIAVEFDGASIFTDGRRNAVSLPAYFRFDLGATKELRLGTAPTGAPLLLRATVEVLNVFDQKNTVAYSWVEQVEEGRRQFTAVPTRLTPRTLNVRFRVAF